MGFKRLDCEEGDIRFGGKRYIFAVLAFFGLFVSFMNYVDLSVAIVAMVRRGEGIHIHILRGRFMQPMNEHFVDSFTPKCIQIWPLRCGLGCVI